MTQLSRFQKTIFSSKFDAVIVSSETNIRYLSDFAYTDGYLLISCDKAFLLSDARYIESARNTVKDFEVILPSGSMLSAIAQIVDENKYVNIAIEENTLSCSAFEDIKGKLPQSCKLQFGASKLLSAQRSVKLPEEISRIAKAQEITDAAFLHILPFLTQKVSELDVANELEFFMRRQGAEGVAFETIAISGSATSVPHGTPSNRPLQKGFLTMDFGAKYMGYCSDMTRTVVLGRASQEHKAIYNAVLEAQKNALDNIKCDMLCKDADALARVCLEKAGYGEAFTHSLGHGVGMYIHEAPNLSRFSDAILTDGNVVTVEPGVYLEGNCGCRIEDMIAINQDGSILNFTRATKELIEI